MDLVTYDDYDKISQEVRRYCAQKYLALAEALQPYISGELGDITPGHATAYINLIKELGRLYKVQAPPRDPEAMIPASKVQQLLQEAALTAERAVQAAVADTEARIRREIAAQSEGDLELARREVLARLEQVRPGRG